LAKGW